MEKISVIIPNFNGRELLAQNLPSVVKNCPDCEIIVVDDGSKDDSVGYVRKNFPKVIVVESPENQGFSKAVNLGVQKASGSQVLLLNSDVSPRKNFLLPLQKYFQKSNNTFGVALADNSHEGKTITKKGRGGATFTRGLFNHFAAQIKKGETLWVSGGSGIFNREKFIALGGFDPVFYPFYWEDIDLSYRAWKSGYVCYFEPSSQVDHYHQKGAIKTKFAWQYIEIVSYKNQFLFIWKNISDPLLLLQHIAWLPYHFVKSVLRTDAYFIVAFFWALLHIPRLIFNRQPLTVNHQLSDRALLQKFEKP